MIGHVQPFAMASSLPGFGTAFVPVTLSIAAVFLFEGGAKIGGYEPAAIGVTL